MGATGAEARIEELMATTASAQEAADAVGCTLSQIVKSVVLVCDEAAVVALVPGDRRADVRRVATAVGGRRARIARADEVTAATGFTPGAVAPFPLPDVAAVLLDRTLLRHPVVWCGAGSDRHLAAIAPHELQRLTRARVVAVADAPAGGMPGTV
jgi:prolyl-tRNA editing enzyme YbaK/EbsC (Cys-tRNA(Pro) deacylase)